MKLKFLLFFICYLFHAQTNKQIDIAYRMFESRCNSTTLKGLSKPLWVNKETYIKDAKFYPVYQVFYNNQNNKQEWKIDEDKFFVLYHGEISEIINTVVYIPFKGNGNKFIDRLLELNTNNTTDTKIGYFEDEFHPPYNTFPNFFIYGKDQYTDKDKTYNNITEIINNRYSSFENYNSKIEMDIKRKSLKPDQIINGIKSYYKLYENYCSKDTALIINKFIENINLATGGLSKKQNKKLKEEIKKQLIFNKESKNNIENIKIAENDIYSIYNIDFSKYFLQTLSQEQSTKYNDYMDVHFPPYIQKKYGRSIYGGYILFNNNIVTNIIEKNEKNAPSFTEFIKQQLKNCGCKIETKGFQIKPQS